MSDDLKDCGCAAAYCAPRRLSHDQGETMTDTTHPYHRLLQPGMIGPVTTRNRIIKTANGTSFMEDDQTVGDRMIAYYERLAAGGVGFLVVESCGVEYPLGVHHIHYFPDGSYQSVQLHLADDRTIPGFQRLTEAVHKQGCPVSLQFQHSGAWNPTGLLPRDMKIRDIKCASALTEEELPGPDFLPCRAMTHQEVQDQVELWAAAAERAQRAGFDACEINHGTFHQGNSFLSRVWNRRDDEYGPQSYENRTRFLREIILEAKRRCGPDFAVHALINIVEYNHPSATTLEEGTEMARLIAQVADGINCRAERYGHRGGLLQPDRILYPAPDLQELPAGLDWSRAGKGATVPLVEAVKAKGVTIPLWTACRLDHDLGEDYLRRGSLDFVGMTRRLIADPELPNKVKENRTEDIRVCHGCLYCFECRNQNKKLECRVNATIGREILPEYQARPAAPKKQVLVVGGGPGGLEAARVAALRGHEVSLYEKGTFLGGLEPLAAIIKDLETEDMLGHVRYLATQLKKLGVPVHLKTPVTRALLEKLKPDAVVLATGAAHTPFTLKGAETTRFIPTQKLHAQLKTALRFLRPDQIDRLSRLWIPVGRTVVVMGGELHGCELAEFLIKRGRRVVIAHDGPQSEIGNGIYRDDQENLWPWFKLKHVPIWTDCTYLEITPEGLKIQLPDKRIFTLRGESVMTTQDWGPNPDLRKDLEELGIETHLIGSAKEPGWIVDAIREGALAGYAL